MINHLAFKEFKVEKTFYRELKKDEAKALNILKEVARIVAKIYLEQENGDEKSYGASLYPSDLSDLEIEEESKKNHLIFSPYTVVEKTADGIIAIPYHQKYKENLVKISDLLVKASKILKNKDLSTYFKITAGALLTGNYKEMDLAWLKSSKSKLFFLIGPYERNLDRRFFIKMSYLCVIGIKDNYFTNKAEEFTKILFTTVGDQPHRYTSPSQVQISSIRNIIFSGFVARALSSTEHIPSNDLTIKEAGSRLLGYLSTMDYKFDTLLYPIFKSIFAKNFRQSYPEDLLKRANYYLMLVYGLARQLHRYEGSRERFRELFPVFDEANSMVSGIQHSKHLILKGVIDQRDLEAMIIMHICWCFSEWVYAKMSSIRNDYLRGDALSLNFYFNQGALREHGSISWPNFSKMFFVIENLSTVFVHLLSEGTHKNAQKFLDDNLSYEPFKAFDKKLSKIHFRI